jgi:hypothetical protein
MKEFRRCKHNMIIIRAVTGLITIHFIHFQLQYVTQNNHFNGKAKY